MRKNIIKTRLNTATSAAKVADGTPVDTALNTRATDTLKTTVATTDRPPDRTTINIRHTRLNAALFTAFVSQATLLSRTGRSTA